METSTTRSLWKSKLRRLRCLNLRQRETVFCPGIGSEIATDAHLSKRRCATSVANLVDLEIAGGQGASSSKSTSDVRRSAAHPKGLSKADDVVQQGSHGSKGDQIQRKHDTGSPMAPLANKRTRGQICSTLALREVVQASKSLKSLPSPDASGTSSKRAPDEQVNHRLKEALDPRKEILRILAAPTAEELLGMEKRDVSILTEDGITQVWKQLVLLLHPDKLRRLSEREQGEGAEALHLLHLARDELRRKAQVVCAQMPPPPKIGQEPVCLDNAQGQRKYEFSWTLPESQDPSRPIVNYEVWGPRYFSEAGDPYDFVLLATLPPLQSQFVLVEEAPTQQDVMWAADRVLRPTLPMTVQAVNGRGKSDELVIELPWATDFPWLIGTPSVMCSQCMTLSACQGQFTKCNGCKASVPDDARIVLRCPECSGEVLWAQGSNLLRCTCCLHIVAKDCGQQWRPGTKPFHMPSPQMKYVGFARPSRASSQPPVPPPQRDFTDGR